MNISALSPHRFSATSHLRTASKERRSSGARQQNPPPQGHSLLDTFLAVVFIGGLVTVLVNPFGIRTTIKEGVLALLDEAPPPSPFPTLLPSSTPDSSTVGPMSLSGASSSHSMFDLVMQDLRSENPISQENGINILFHGMHISQKQRLTALSEFLGRDWSHSRVAETLREKVRQLLQARYDIDKEPWSLLQQLMKTPYPSDEFSSRLKTFQQRVQALPDEYR